MQPAGSNGGDNDLKPQWDKSYDSKTVGHLMARAREAHEAGNVVDALRYAKDAKRRQPLNADIKMTLAQLHIQMGSFDKAVDEIYNLLDLDPKNPALLRLTGYCLEKIGRNEEALHLYERFARIARTSEKPHYYMGSVLFKLERIDEAIEAYETAVEINPDIPESHEALGAAWHQVERYEEAIASFKKAISVDPDYAPAYNSLGTSYFADGKKEQGMEYVRRAIQIDPNLSAAYANLGSMAAMAKNTRVAMEMYSAALNRDPYNASVWKNLLIAINDELPKAEGWEIDEPNRDLEAKPLGRWHYEESIRFSKAGDSYKSARHLIAAIRADSQVPKYFNDLGAILGGTTYPILAVHFFQMALFMNPNFELAESNLQKHIITLGEVRSARVEQQYLDIIKQNPTNSLIHYRLGNFYATQGKYTNALPHMVSAVQLSPANIMPRLGLTRTLYAGGQIDHALETLLGCFDVDPTSFAAWQQLFLALHLMLPKLPEGEALKQPEETLESAALAAWHYRRGLQSDTSNSNQWIHAARHLHVAVVNDPTIPEYFDDYGMLIKEKLSARVALPFFQKALISDEKNKTFQAHFEKGRMAAKEERFALGKNLRLAQLKEDPTNPQRLIDIALFLAQNDRLADTLPYLQRAIEYSPTNQSAIITLARVQHQSGDTAASIETIEQLIQLEPENAFFKFRKAYLISAHNEASSEQIKLGLSFMEAVLASAGADATANLYRVNATLFARNGEYEKAVRQAVAAAKLAQKEGDEDAAREILAEAQQYKSLAEK